MLSYANTNYLLFYPLFSPIMTSTVFKLPKAPEKYDEIPLYFPFSHFCLFVIILIYVCS